MNDHSGFKALGNIDMNGKSFIGNILATGITYLENLTKKALSASVAIQTVYVDLTSGNDSTGDGSSSTPYKTIQKAVDILPRVITKDTIIAISNGTSSEAVDTSGIIVSASLTFKAMDTSDNQLYDLGTATSGGNTTLTDTSKSWAIDTFINGKIFIYAGTGIGQIRDISDNDANIITVSAAWDINPGATSKYVIVSPVKFNSSSGYPLSFSNMKDIYIYGFQFIDSASYSISLQNKSVGAIQYNYFGGTRGFILDQHSVSSDSCNFFSVGANMGMVASGLSVFSGRYSVFVARSAGAGYGIFSYRNCFMIGNGTSYFKDLGVGIYLGSGSTGDGMSSNTFINCTTDVTASSYDNSIDIISDILRLRTAKTPSSASDTGLAGQICWDTNYIYICTATNTWKRVAITTWP